MSLISPAVPLGVGCESGANQRAAVVCKGSVREPSHPRKSPSSTHVTPTATYLTYLTTGAGLISQMLTHNFV